MNANVITRRRILIALLIVVGLGVAVAAAAYALTRPSQDDFTTAKTTQLKAIGETRKDVVPAVNEYLAAFKAAYNESKSAESASSAVKDEHDAFKQAVASSETSLKALDDNRVSNDSDVGPAIDQLTTDYEAELTFYSGLVNDYPKYTTLFAEGAGGCSGIFVGQADGLADRKSKLDAAAEQCYEALSELKRSSNVVYADYAKKIERRVKNLQADADTTVKAEQSLKEFEKRAADYQRQYADATARSAPDEEIQKLADELKQFNAEIDDNRANFDFAAKNYLDTVKEIPGLFSAVFDTNVPAKQKVYSQLIDMRTQVLESLLNGRV